MQCPNCGRDWPDEFKVCPICAVNLSAQVGEASSAAIAQGAGAAAAEDRSIAVSGPVFGSIYQVYLAPSGEPSLSSEEARRILDTYLRWVCNAFNKARLYGLESLSTAGGKPVRELKDVFVPLTLRHFRPPRQRDLEELSGEGADPEALARAWMEWGARQEYAGDEVALDRLLTVSERIAMVGGAGSGKSTLLAYLAVALAEAARKGSQTSVHLPDPEHPLVPLLIPLRYYRDYLDKCCRAPGTQLDEPQEGTLRGFITWYLRRRGNAPEQSRDFFDRLLLGGGCLLMLDGLDEVTDRQGRGQVRQEVEDLVNDIYPGNRVIVTAREAGYRDEAVFGDDFARLDVQRLEDEQIRALVANWCRQLYPGEEDTRTDELMQAIQEINQLRVHRDLSPLVSTPLMTTMVVSVKWGETDLPRERAKLYEAGVKVILQAQYVPEDPARQELVEWGGPWDSQRDWLSTLALGGCTRAAAAGLPFELSGCRRSWGRTWRQKRWIALCRLCATGADCWRSEESSSSSCI